ncbi:MAG TPA: bifunctional methionine sulfoxide reductase B/A protein [Planctomycetaceae bacterium]|jgi:peptide methionine sulfoxide reductase msrA/msrB|nr:bifunctional methionine sulfoxide reductase B/A protein [Planctomycetaceae bacterium]
MKRCRQIPWQAGPQLQPTNYPAKTRSGPAAGGWTAALELLCVVLVYGSLSLSGCTNAALDEKVQAADKRQQEKGPMVRVRVFDRNGKLVGPIETHKLDLSTAEWERRLTKDQFHILRAQGTERAFCGTLLDNHKDGVYTCAGCGLPLFASDSKFNSGTGWPSFFQPICKENVIEHNDSSLGVQRTEILCARCGGHLGHVFEDGPRPTGLRFCLNSESLKFTDKDKLASLADPIADKRAAADPTSKHGHATAVFAGGCFWCTEAAFEQLKGIIDVESGYAGGSKETANYERVCAGDTGHAEAIRVTYDPKQISYDRLLDAFYNAHDPTSLNRQGHDVGTQYRSAIFYANESEERAARAKIKHLTETKAFPDPIVTSLEPLKEFYPAETYHQDYAKKHPDQPYIAAHALPLAEKVREKLPELIKPEESKR